MRAGHRTGVTDPADLAGSLDRPGTVVLEVGRTEDRDDFRRGHIPGARYVYWRDLTWSDSGRSFPEPALLAQRLGRLGVAASTDVVICGSPVQFGVYTAWVLAMRGHPRVSVLDGGKEYWQAAGLPLSSHDGDVTPRRHTPGSRDDSSRVSRDEVLAALDAPGITLLDFRSPEEYAGERVSPSTAPFDHGAQCKGRIPGAKHLFYQRLLTTDARFRSRDEIVAEFASVGVAEGSSVIGYCRMGHRASLGRFALTHLAGVLDARVYDGSWTEWGSMVDMPVER